VQLLTHRSQERVAPCSRQSLRVDHQAGNGRWVRLGLGRSGGRQSRFTQSDTLLLEPQFEQGGDQQGIEVKSDAFWGVTEQMQAIQRPFQKPEDQLHLPAVGIQQDDLERSQIPSIGQNQVPVSAYLERDQAVDGLAFGVSQAYSLG
jgi:hypothetical protein